jgi:hypothetical protein
LASAAQESGFPFVFGMLGVYRRAVERVNKLKGHSHRSGGDANSSEYHLFGSAPKIYFRPE